MKKCVFIIPYFGQFNNYFDIYLKTCALNKNFDWIFFTDIRKIEGLPQNIKFVYTTFEQNKKMFEEKLGFEVKLNSFHKLCEFKPTYGYLYNEYIKDYEYWGYCDCDLIFGNLEKFLAPLMNEKYDKIFAAGHLTLIKNTDENNTLFKSNDFYKEVFTSDDNYAFDEDFYDNNIHTIFIDQNKKIYEKDLSMNTTTSSGRFIREYYDGNKRKFIKEKYKRARYFWRDGNIYRYYLENGKIKNEEFIYMHFQMRKMRNKIRDINVKQFEILPDRFIESKIDLNQLKKDDFVGAGFTYLYWYDCYIKKIQRKLKKWLVN